MLASLLSAGSNGEPAAHLALADGTVFRGVSIGAHGHCVGEVVFNTAMTGHQEIMTDPGYSGQILSFTYPHIGSTGVNEEDLESNSAQMAGLVIRDCPRRISNFRATQSLPEYLRSKGVVAIAGVDTRRLARKLRQSGRQNACIWVGEQADEALALARQAPVNHVAMAADTALHWSQGLWKLSQGYPTVQATGPHIVVYDLGVKYGVLRELADRRCRLSCVAANTPVSEVLALQPDGIVLSNGPGDPTQHSIGLGLAKALLDTQVPLLGIALGMQLIALALGGRLTSLLAGHHGINHPVQHIASGRVYISSQNQNFAVVPDSLPSEAVPTFVSLFDGSLQGFELTGRKILAFQGHPEASPGPHDLAVLFDQFLGFVAQPQ